MAKRDKNRDNVKVQHDTNDINKPESNNRFYGLFENKIFNYTALLLLFIAVSIINNVQQIDDYDIWFHLKYGEHYVKNMTWNIDHSVFSWTPTVSDWKYVTWLSDAVLYIIYSFAGFQGLIVLRFVIYLFVGTLCMYFVRLSGGKLDIICLMLLMILYVILNLVDVLIKPDLFSTMFFTLIVFIYFIFRFNQKNLLYFYPVIFFMWVNSHGGFIVGLFFISLILGFELLCYILNDKDSLTIKCIVKFSLSVFVSYVFTFFNPYGFYYHYSIVKSLFFSDYMELSGALMAYANLWKYVFFKNYDIRFVLSAWGSITMMSIFIFISVYVFLKKRYLKPILLITNIVFFFISMSGARMVKFFPIVCLFSIILLIKENKYLSIIQKLKPVSLLLFLFFSVISTFSLLVMIPIFSWFGTDIDEMVPKIESEFVVKNKLPKPIFNDYLSGTYMLWSMYPDYKVFVDARYGPYTNGVLQDSFALSYAVAEKRAKILDILYEKYKFKTALVHLREFDVIYTMLSSPHWRMVYFEKNAVVFVHRSELSSLQTSVMQADLETDRFNNLKDPISLFRLFHIYINLFNQFDHPLYMFSVKKATEIIDIYKRNVPFIHINKAAQISYMEKLRDGKVKALEMEYTRRKNDNKNSLHNK